MTHEQKPESAEFRTREAQKTALAEALEDGMSRHASTEEAERHIAEAEARGAAEQRRKDAEGDDPKAWIVTQGFYVPFVTLDVGLLRGKPHSIVTPLYTRPANVAALEDRVKELEAEKYANEVAAFERGFQGGRRDRYKQYERDTAEAVAAERERCAGIIEDHCEVMGGGSGKKLGPRSGGDKMALAYAAAIREGG